MPGPMPKDPSTRQRRNRTSTAALLAPNPDAVVPELGFDVQERTAAWWRDVWTSPMAGEYDDTDRHGLAMLALLVDAFWRSSMRDDEPKGDPLKLLAEIRQQSQRYGLSPIDRRRLQWEIERTEEAKVRGERRRSTSTRPVPKGDPRATLRAV